MAGRPQLSNYQLVEIRKISLSYIAMLAQFAGRVARPDVAEGFPLFRYAHVHRGASGRPWRAS